MIREFVKGNNKTDAGVKEKTPALKKKYEVIYADPPWRFRVRTEKGKGRSAENHYPTMKLEDICKLPVKEIAADDSILFMWATFPNLKEAFDVIDAWGFDYKTVAFVWVKQNKKSDSLFMGLGYWTRSNVEMCIIATKGHPKRIGRDVHQVIISHIEEHSKKPAETRDRIVNLMGDVPRVELFARHKTPGWDTWGNEVGNDLELVA